MRLLKSSLTLVTLVTLACAFTINSYCAITVAIPKVSPTQAVMLITGATTGVPCQIEVSETPTTYTPLVYDFNATYFPGANFDSRAGALTLGTTRIIPIGTRRYDLTTITSNAYADMFYNNLPSGIHYAARTAGASGNLITIEYVVTAINQTLGVTVSGNAITVTLATNSGAASTSIASDVLAAVQANSAANALVSSTLMGDGTGHVDALKLIMHNGTLTVSRALQQATQHYYRVSACGTATGTFTTKTLDFGNTYADLMSMDSSGAYVHPDSVDSRGYAIDDAKTGVQQVMVSQYSDITNNGQPLDGSSGGSGSYCADDLSNSVWWHCALTSHSASALYLYGIQKDTFEVRFLGQLVGAQAIDSGEEVGWVAGDPNTLYFSADDHGRSTIQKYHYTGNDIAATGPNYVAPADPIVDVTGGADLTTLVRGFNSHISDNDLIGTVTTTIGTSCSVLNNVGAGGGGAEYIVNWVSGAKFLDGHELIGQFIQINGIVYVVCDSNAIPTQTQLRVYDRYARSAPAAGSPVPYRFNMFNCAMVGIQADAMLKCAAGAQDSPSWQAVFSFGNGIPYGTGGSTAGIIAAMLPMANPKTSWSSNHTYEFMGESIPIYPWQVSKIFDFGINSGPYQVQLGTTLAAESLPAPVVGYTPVIDTNVLITSAGLIGNHLTYTPVPIGHVCDDTWTTPEPGWVDGQPLSPCYPHYVQPLAVGDVLAFVESDFSISEFVQIAVIHDATHYDIIRGTQSDIGTSPSHSIGARLTMWPQSDGAQFNPSKGLGWAVVMWNYKNSPNGTEHAEDVGWNWGIHSTTRLKTRTITVQFDSDAGATNQAHWGRTPPYGLPVDSNFNGCVATASGDFFQKHPSMASGTDSTQFDVWYFVGASTAPVTPVGSYTHVFKASSVGPPICPKLMPVFAKTKGKNLVDVSAPGRILTDADDNVWCYVRIDGECAIGSHVGESYIALSSLDPMTNFCPNGENPSGFDDICIANFSALGLSNNQQKFLTTDIRGYSMRRLTSPFATWELQNELDGNIKLTFDGKIGLVWRFPNGAPGEIAGAHGFPGHPAEVWAIKIPSDPGDDGIDRTKFIPATLNLTAPTGLSITGARAKFWYAEWGGSLSSPYCTQRREGCVATKSTFAPVTNFCSFANACAVDVTSLGLVTPYSPADNPMFCNDASGNPLSSSSSVDGFDTIPAMGGPAGQPLTQVRPFYPVNSNITCGVQATPFNYMTTETYTPASCATTCTIVLPVVPHEMAYYNVEYLNAGGSVVSSESGVAMENTVIPLGGSVPPPTSTTLSLISSANPASSGASVTFTATLTPSSGPTGTITFKDGSATIGTGTVSSGVATFTTSALSIGSHSITAVYNGDSTYATSTSSAVTQVINGTSTTTGLVSSLNPSVIGNTVTFTASITPSLATGTVTFKDGITVVGTGTITSGTATTSTSLLSIGSHSITAVYNGDSTYAVSTSSAVTQVVNSSTPIQSHYSGVVRGSRHQ